MLKNIEIIDYKCFKNFKLEGLSQINIISGGNNVGKTALLEAFLLINNSDYVRNFVKIIKLILNNRDFTEEDSYIYLERINVSFKNSNKKVHLEYKYIDYLDEEENLRADRYIGNNAEDFLVLTIDKEFQIMPLLRENGLSYRSRIYDVDISFIDSSKPKNSELTRLYSAIQDDDMQERFLKYLQIIDKNIIGVEPQLKARGQSFLRVTIDNPKKSLLSSELGEGTNRFIEILAELLSSKNTSIYIDEIENGIHHSKLKDIWKAIIEIVQIENIQLFVTTHDEDTIKALVEASEEMKYEDVASIKLIKDEDNKVVSIVKKFKNFAYGINRGADVR